MARRTRREAEQTRDALLVAAETVFFEQGVAHTSLERIAREAGVTRGAVYWHFRNKNDLFDAMVARVQIPLADIHEQLQAAHREGRFSAGLARIAVEALVQLAHSDRHRRVYAILFHRSEMVPDTSTATANRTSRNRSVQQMLEDYFAQAHSRGRLRTGLTPAQAAWAFRSSLVGLLSDWLRDGDGLDLERDGIPVIHALINALLLPEDNHGL